MVVGGGGGGGGGDGGLFGILKVEALRSKLHVGLSFDVSPTTLEEDLTTGPCHR